jgi:hypothetical protein
MSFSRGNHKIQVITDLLVTHEASIFPSNQEGRDTDQLLLFPNTTQVGFQSISERAPPCLQPGGQHEKAFPF